MKFESAADRVKTGAQSFSVTGMGITLLAHFGAAAVNSPTLATALGNAFLAVVSVGMTGLGIWGMKESVQGNGPELRNN